MNKENNPKIAEAFDVIKQAMIEDNPSESGSYAHSWHCNIKMMCYDAIETHEMTIAGALADDTESHNDRLKVSEDAASRFMKLCFGVETKG